ncbi:restriction endonuclease [Bacillus niameyensis]|uniref:restriction endonuclease n=1 Tax=Bacillus niameyensis TaxID=1522308 RepID=UPI000AD63A96|nr:restriction endonuclease [Bacillus niameyensis]
MENWKMGIDLFWGIVTAEPKLTLFIILLTVIPLIVSFISYTIKQYKLKKSGILEVDKMSGGTFEEYLGVLLKSRGYHVRLTPKTGDFGADLVISKDKRKIIVQAKRYKNKVGIKAVQEIASAKTHYQADECWVITNSFFTEPARKLATSNQVRLINRTELMKWMLEGKEYA